MTSFPSDIAKKSENTTNNKSGVSAQSQKAHLALLEEDRRAIKQALTTHQKRASDRANSPPFSGWTTSV